MGRLVEASVSKSRWPFEKPRTDLARGLFRSRIAQRRELSAEMDLRSRQPVRAGLAERSDDWPYQGEIVYIDRASASQRRICSHRPMAGWCEHFTAKIDGRQG